MIWRYAWGERSCAKKEMFTLGVWPFQDAQGDIL